VIVQIRPLVDSFGRVHTYLRLSITDKCNLRCTYCVSPDYPGSRKSSSPSFPHLERLLKIFVGRCGITKIRLTGGEPTIHPYFNDYLSLLSSLSLTDRGITTNGVLFNKMNEIAKHFNRVNVSLDTLDREKFPLISNRDPNVFDNVLKSIRILASGSTKVKINTVVMRGINDDDLLDILHFADSFPNITVRFIELMPFNGNGHANKLFLSKDEMLGKISRDVTEIPSNELSSSAGQLMYSVPGLGRPFGIISSMTDIFCGSCNRIRLTSDGKLRNCLFSDTDTETDLVAMIVRGCSDDELENAIRENIGGKFISHGGKKVDELWHQSQRNRSMISLGG